MEREFQDQQKEWFDKHVFKKQSTLFIICNQKIDNIRRNIKMRGIREGLALRTPKTMKIDFTGKW